MRNSSRKSRASGKGAVVSLRLYHSEDGSVLDGHDLSNMSSWEILAFARELETEANLLEETAACPSLGDENVACVLQDMTAMAVIAIRYGGAAAERVSDDDMQNILYLAAGWKPGQFAAQEIETETTNTEETYHVPTA
jgi:hypothetical protein